MSRCGLNLWGLLHYVTNTDILGVLMGSRGLPWLPTVVSMLAPGQFMGTFGHLWAPLVTHEHPWLFTSAHGS